MNALTQHPQSASPERQTTLGLSPGLTSLLVTEARNEVAVREIATNPSMLAQAREALPSLEAIARSPAGKDRVKAVVGKRFATYPQPDRSEAEWAAWWNAYYIACADIPESALEAGMAAWIRKPDDGFLPKAGRLRQLALMTENRAVRAYERARAAVEYEPPRQYDPVDTPRLSVREMRPEPTEADRQMVKRMMADYLARQPEKPPEQQMRANHAAVDETGISPQLRAIMESRG